ncbi:hypothetical protein BLNAU_7302 [Blattamonas nauphoetae]|uniref:Uncharacterized protein n=1 Tax=Blattamonas nauphoetae TaxID=2049346 RepID=A0ABQ9Y1N3_9EUKA|nr:hypothetical protein BLNAU_7302 [Blattamonas nauphoetae]
MEKGHVQILQIETTADASRLKSNIVLHSSITPTDKVVGEFLKVYLRHGDKAYTLPRVPLTSRITQPTQMVSLQIPSHLSQFALPTLPRVTTVSFLFRDFYRPQKRSIWRHALSSGFVEAKIERARILHLFLLKVTHSLLARQQHTSIPFLWLISSIPVSLFCQISGLYSTNSLFQQILAEKESSKTLGDLSPLHLSLVLENSSGLARIAILLDLLHRLGLVQWDGQWNSSFSESVKLYDSLAEAEASPLLHPQSPYSSSGHLVPLQRIPHAFTVRNSTNTSLLFDQPTNEYFGHLSTQSFHFYRFPNQTPQSLTEPLDVTLELESYTSFWSMIKSFGLSLALFEYEWIPNSKVLFFNSLTQPNKPPQVVSSLLDALHSPINRRYFILHLNAPEILHPLNWTLSPNQSSGHFEGQLPLPTTVILPLEPLTSDLGPHPALVFSPQSNLSESGRLSSFSTKTLRRYEPLYALRFNTRFTIVEDAQNNQGTGDRDRVVPKGSQPSNREDWDPKLFSSEIKNLKQPKPRESIARHKISSEYKLQLLRARLASQTYLQAQCSGNGDSIHPVNSVDWRWVSQQLGNDKTPRQTHQLFARMMMNPHWRQIAAELSMEKDPDDDIPRTNGVRTELWEIVSKSTHGSHSKQIQKRNKNRRPKLILDESETSSDFECTSPSISSRDEPKDTPLTDSEPFQLLDDDSNEDITFHSDTPTKKKKSSSDSAFISTSTITPIITLIPAQTISLDDFKRWLSILKCFGGVMVTAQFTHPRVATDHSLVKPKFGATFEFWARATTIRPFSKTISQRTSIGLSEIIDYLSTNELNPEAGCQFSPFYSPAAPMSQVTVSILLSLISSSLLTADLIPPPTPVSLEKAMDSHLTQSYWNQESHPLAVFCESDPDDSSENEDQQSILSTSMEMQSLKRLLLELGTLSLHSDGSHYLLLDSAICLNFDKKQLCESITQFMHPSPPESTITVQSLTTKNHDIISQWDNNYQTFFADLSILVPSLPAHHALVLYSLLQDHPITIQFDVGQSPLSESRCQHLSHSQFYEFSSELLLLIYTHIFLRETSYPLSLDHLVKLTTPFLDIIKDTHCSECNFVSVSVHVMILIANGLVQSINLSTGLSEYSSIDSRRKENLHEPLSTAFFAASPSPPAHSPATSIARAVSPLSRTDINFPTSNLTFLNLTKSVAAFVVAFPLLPRYDRRCFSLSAKTAGTSPRR